MDSNELISLQREAAKSLTGADDDQKLLEVAGSLAGTLRKVVDDRTLWSELAAGTGSAVERGQLALLVSVDWGAILSAVGHEPPPPDELVAAELASAAGSAQMSHDPEQWYVVQEQLAWLAGQLEANVEQPAPSAQRGWWRSLRKKVAVGVTALRHVSLGAVLTGAAKSAAGSALMHAVLLAVAGTPFGPVAILGSAAAGLAGATAAEMQRYIEGERAANEVEPVIDRHALLPAEAGRQKAALETIIETAREAARAFPGGDTSHVSGVVALVIPGVQSWLAQIGAVLASAWSLVAAADAARGLAYIDEAQVAMLDARQALVDLEEAVSSQEVDVLQAKVDAASRRIDGLSDAAMALMRFLIDERLEPHT